MHRTLVQCAAASGVHWQVWYLTECGCYEQIPKRIRQYLSHRLAERYDDVEEKYRTYQRISRENARELLQANQELPQSSLTYQPFRAYRETIGVSRAYLAKILCVQPAILYKLESGRSRNLPESLTRALKEAGLPVEIIEELDARTEEYYESH